jgi:cytochrome c-type biogenesis protein CcmH
MFRVSSFPVLIGIVLGLLLNVPRAYAAIDVYDFTNEVDKTRYQSFIDEMRCPKCQNQNLSGSDSPIAKDLRRELYTMIHEGKSDREIIDFMVERYGDFILYRPRLTSSTVLLWVAPLVLVILGIVVILVVVSRRRRLAVVAAAPLSDNERARLKKLLAQEKNK